MQRRWFRKNLKIQKDTWKPQEKAWTLKVLERRYKRSRVLFPKLGSDKNALMIISHCSPSPNCGPYKLVFPLEGLWGYTNRSQIPPFKTWELNSLRRKFWRRILSYFYIYLFIYLLWGWVGVHLWRSEHTFGESVLSFHHVGYRNWTEVVRLGGKHLCPLNHLVSLSTLGFKTSNIQDASLLQWF